MIDYLTDPAHWTGKDGIWMLLAEHLLYSFIALIVACAIAIPLGLYIGYTRKGQFLVAGLANALRALPTVGLLILMVMIISPFFASRLAFVIPSLIVLVLLAVPPILTSTYAGIMAVDASAVDAAKGMGFRPMRVLTQVQIPCATPLILSGIRSSLLQIISTATVAAYISLGGLGRLLIDGRAQNDYGQMAAGAVLVAALALVFELGLGYLTKRVVSPGLSRRTVKERRRETVGVPVPA
ncbi:ABC transporter permease subunit [Lysinibacter cavernae]|uniref:Osmoprotectant transport system permease protein n=1 Tax=Lysinibacter cavernae TaxID=1640652 RepID=A0A7X5R099_9MICO|nr:osmoprotectant transport system permease protein [Lysinibacter cavernae]